MLKNREIKETVSAIEIEMEAELKANKDALEAPVGGGVDLGGLHRGIEDVASNVTYI